MPNKNEITIEIPKNLEMELKALVETGYYKNMSEFIKDAIKVILAVRKDLRIEISCLLYKEGKISLGKAVEIADTNYEEMKEILARKGIGRRIGSETVEELKEALENLEEWKEKEEKK